MIEDQPMTERQMIRGLAALDRNDPSGAAALYRRARASECDARGLAMSLCRLQDDDRDLQMRLASIDAEHGRSAPQMAASF